MRRAGERLRPRRCRGWARRRLEDLPDAPHVAVELVVAEVLEMVDLLSGEGAPERGKSGQKEASPK